MKKKDLYTLMILILLTVTTAVFSVYFSTLKFIVPIILTISGIKFILVAFQFMELKKASPFWKTILIIYLLIYITVISTIVMI